MRCLTGFSGLLAVFVLSATLLVSVSPAMTQNGKVVGAVFDAETGEPLMYANVEILGTPLGGVALGDGRFQIAGVPPGTYTVQVSMMGYEVVKKEVKVESGREVEVEFALATTIVDKTEVIVVTAETPQIEKTGSQTLHTIENEEMLTLPADNLNDVVSLETGAVNQGGEIHWRGGRVDEVENQIDGVPVDDPLRGATISVGLIATDRSEVIVGGMDAEFGNAQSAVINVSTKEGGEDFQGQFRYMTDDFGRKDKTYTNYDRVSIGFGGPAFIEHLTYYVSGEATFTDSEHWTVARRDELNILGDLVTHTPRLNESYNLQGKIAWQMTPQLKVTGEAIYGHASIDRYFHNWNIDGYAQKIYRFASLAPPRDAMGEDARSFGGYVSVYHGPWIDERPQRAALYPSTIEERRRCIYPVVVFTKVRDPDNPNLEPYRIRYDHFYARLVRNTRGEEIEVIWDEAVIDQNGQLERYESRMLFEGFQNPESGFSHFNDDTSYVYFNSAERTATSVSDNMIFKLALNHNISPELLYTITLSFVQFNTNTSVGGKEPAAYETAGLPVIMPDGSYRFGGVSSAQYYTDPRYPYFVTGYDYPSYSRRVSTFYLFKTDLTSKRWKDHRFKTGLQLKYNDLDEEARFYPGLERLLEDDDRVQGLSVNTFHTFNPEASFYVQDKWDYQGMYVNAGLRIDFFSPGSNAEIAVVSSEIDPHVEKYKFQVSPRIGFAFPVTDRDKFHFHYGRFTQWPGRDYLFRSQDMITWGQTIGNPDLDEELNVAYQAGISHQFTETIAGHFTVFAKDIYGLLSSTRVTDEGLGIQGTRFINRTYASSRGLEVSLDKRLSNYIGGEISYTYSYADGVASDADFGVTAEGLTHLPTQELPLNWDQRHTFNMTLRLQDANRWGATVVYSYGSGFPWTPYDRFARRQDPLDENSLRLPSLHIINIQGRKKFSIYGQELTLFFEGRNLLDEDVLAPGMTAPGAWPNMIDARMDGGSYLTETGRYGGAYLQDIDDDGIDDFTPVNDPTVWSDHRRWRIGFGFEF